jgi:anti-sigma B factor antagonist
VGTDAGNGLGIDIGFEDRITTIRVAGEVDVATAPQLRECLHNVDGVVVVDLTEVTFLDSTGLNVLVNARKRLLAVGGQLGLRNARAPVQRILQVAGVDDWFY